MTQSFQPAAQNSQASPHADRQPGTLFGVPVGDLGWFTTLLMGFASAFAAFFAATFCGIVTILIYNTATHGTIDYALSYKVVGLPIGLLALAVALGYLGTLWFRRIFRRAPH
jgi:hypothetical protein